jgi:aspartate aminotransferase
MIELAGGRPIIVRTTAASRYKLTPEQLRAALSPRTRWVVVNSPSNPTGFGYTRNDLRALGDVLQGTRVGVISDEVYEKLCFSHFEFHSFGAVCPEMIDRVVTVNAFSKTYSMTGWRVGYAVGPKEIIEAMGRHQSQTTSNVNTIAQAAAYAALRGNHDFLRPMVESFQRRMKLASEILATEPLLASAGEPDGAFYLFVGASDFFRTPGGARLGGSGALASALLETGGVAVVPGQAFGDDHAFRVSISSAEENVRNGMQALVQAVRALAER